MAKKQQKKISKIQRSDFHLKLVHDISEMVNQAEGLETILQGVIKRIHDSLTFNVVSIYLWDEAKGELVMRANKGLKIDLKKPIRLKPGEGLTGFVYESRRSHIIVPASKHSHYKFFPDIREKVYECYLGAPILLHNRCIGVLVGQNDAKRMIRSAEESLFQIIASRLAGLLEVADRLERLKTPIPEKRELAAHQGKGVSSGFAVGPVYLFRGLFQELSIKDYQPSSVKEEMKRLEKASIKVEKDLTTFIDSLKRDKILSESEINIFQTHQLILKDPSYEQAIQGQIHKGQAAERAVVEGTEFIARQFEKIEDPYFKERVNDFRDIGEKLLQSLVASRGKKDVTEVPLEGSIVVARDLGPSFLTSLHKHRIAGIVTEQGGETSHTAILARTLGIPAVAGVEKISNMVQPGDRLLVDGKTGFIFTNPEQSLIQEYQNTHAESLLLREAIEKECAKSLGKNAVPVNLSANIGFPADIEIAKQYCLKDVGLFRTEFAFMREKSWPTVENQAALYEEVAKSFEGCVAIRTLDVGADKLLPYFKFPEEANPLLGLRSIRFSMEYLDLFKEQIKGILIAVTRGQQFRVLLPMVTNLWEVETAREILEEVGKEVGVPSKALPPLGVLIEVPGTIYQLEDFKDLIDFVSIGTNDLIQYLIAVDRNSSVVGHLYSGFHPAVIRILDDIFHRAKAAKKEVTICGELAGTPAGALALLSLGYRNLSVVPTRAPLIRYLCNRLNKSILDVVYSWILYEKKEQEIRGYLTDQLEKIDPNLVQLD